MFESPQPDIREREPFIGFHSPNLPPLPIPASMIGGARLEIDYSELDALHHDRGIILNNPSDEPVLLELEIPLPSVVNADLSLLSDADLETLLERVRTEKYDRDRRPRMPRS